MEENFTTRLKFFIDSLHVPSTQFADMCGIPRPSFSQLLSGRNQKVSDVLIRKIHAAYPELSVVWLMFGEGPMLSKQHTTGQPSGQESEKTEVALLNPEENLTGTNNDAEERNLRALTQGDYPHNQHLYQQLEENKKILELQLQIEKMKENPRKVVQITVYYDDSTFDTFIPKK